MRSRGTDLIDWPASSVSSSSSSSSLTTTFREPGVRRAARAATEPLGSPLARPACCCTTASSSSSSSSSERTVRRHRRDESRAGGGGSDWCGGGLAGTAAARASPAAAMAGSSTACTSAKPKAGGAGARTSIEAGAGGVLCGKTTTPPEPSTVEGSSSASVAVSATGETFSIFSSSASVSSADDSSLIGRSLSTLKTRAAEVSVSGPMTAARCPSGEKFSLSKVNSSSSSVLVSSPISP